MIEYRLRPARMRRHRLYIPDKALAFSEVAYPLEELLQDGSTTYAAVGNYHGSTYVQERVTVVEILVAEGNPGVLRLIDRVANGMIQTGEKEVLLTTETVEVTTYAAV